MCSLPRYHILVLARRWSNDYWNEIHHDNPDLRRPNTGPSSFMENRIAQFDGEPSQDDITPLLKQHDAMLALYDGHVERAAVAVIDDATWLRV